CSAAFTPFVPAAPRTLVVITGTADSMIYGRPVVVSPANSIVSLTPAQDDLWVMFDFVGPTQSSYTQFIIRPPTGQTFEIGQEYQGASVADATHARFRIVINGAACDAASTFTVRD